jgi:mannitol-1-phosphate 5-dehydrogenase
MKGLIFGAGNIGRGFLGLLLSKAGFEITFVDVDPVKVMALTERRTYPVFVVGNDTYRTEVVHGVHAIHAGDMVAIIGAVREADIILTAVGKDALKYVAPTLARGLYARARDSRAHTHVIVIACENVQDNTRFLRNLLVHEMPGEEYLLERNASFPNCVVDRIVPNTLPISCDDGCAVAVEEYFQLAIDGAALTRECPNIPGVDISENLHATLEQKLCTLNMAHAIVAYYGYARGHSMIHEAVDDPHVSALLDGALSEVSTTLVNRHPSITQSAQDVYARSVRERFRNKHLRDEIVRVARQPERKLGVTDRLVHPALLTWEQGRIPAYLATGIATALRYDYGEDAQAQALVRKIRETGVETVLRQVSGLAPESELGRLIKADFLLRAL